MDFSLPFLVFFMLLVVTVSHAAHPSQLYWNNVLPNTPMPTAIQELLSSDGTSVAEKMGTTVEAGKGVNVYTNPKGKPVSVNVGPYWNSFKYLYAATQDQLHDDPNAAFFFLQKDLHPGANMTLRFARTTTSAAFLPRRTANSIPFSSTKLPDVLARFSIQPASADSKLMAQTLHDCEAPVAAGETRYCATSLESMVDFTTGSLDTKKVVAVSTEVSKEGSLKQQYTITASGMREIDGGVGSKVVACHSQPYVYTVFYCHVTSSTKAYLVSMVGADGTKAEAVAVCHTDTSKWNPDHLAFKVLKVKPGSVPVCHFLPQDHVVWSTKK